MLAAGGPGENYTALSLKRASENRLFPYISRGNKPHCLRAGRSNKIQYFQNVFSKNPCLQMFARLVVILAVLGLFSLFAFLIIINV